MSSNPRGSSEPEMKILPLEERLRHAAATFRYPETPNLAARERLPGYRSARQSSQRNPHRLAWGLALVLLALFVLLMVSPVRARVLDWIRIGAVQIFFTQPTATVPALPTLGSGASPGTPAPGVAQAPQPTPTPLKSVLNLAGETTLAQAQGQVSFPIQLPAYPADLGSPDAVFLQEPNGPFVVLVWMEPGQPGKVRLSLSEASSDRMIFQKYAPKSLQNTQVNGHAVVWIDGEYLLVVRSGDMTLTRLITQGHTLIWTAAGLTFRLETDLELAEAIRMAESLH